MEEKTTSEEQESSFEMMCGVTLAIFACVLALANLGGDNADHEALNANTQQASAYQWYSTKGIKAELADGNKKTLQSLLAAGVISKEHAASVEERIRNIENDSKRYRKEAREILEGSKAVGKDNWAQDVNGKLGEITGAKEYEALNAKLAESGDTFDQAVLFLELTMILGALSLLLRAKKLKLAFFGVMVVVGLLGTYFYILGTRSMS